MTSYPAMGNYNTSNSKVSNLNTDTVKPYPTGHNPYPSNMTTTSNVRQNQMPIQQTQQLNKTLSTDGL